MDIFLYVFLIAMISFSVATILLLVRMCCPYLFEINSRERKMLLAMLKEIGRYPEEWEKHHRDYTHVTGVIINSCEAKVGGETVRFGLDSKGRRILEKTIKRIEKMKSRENDLATLKAMSVALADSPDNLTNQ